MLTVIWKLWSFRVLVKGLLQNGCLGSAISENSWQLSKCGSSLVSTPVRSPLICHPLVWM